MVVTHHPAQRVAKTILPWLMIYGIMVGVSAVVRVPGSDWVHHWQPRFEINAYPPWIELLLFLLPGLPFLSGLTLTALLLALRLRRANHWHILAAFSAMPLFWTLWLGQIDAVPLLGLISLPWGLPLVLLKPQVAIWYVWSWWRKRPDRWLIALVGVAFLGSTLLIWGWWPGRFSAPAAYRTVYDLSAWRLHWILGATALLGALLESDPDRAMALGALAAPYIQGASYFVLLPTLARLSGWPLLVVWLTSWAGTAALFFGDAARPLAALFPLALWTALRWTSNRRPFLANAQVDGARQAYDTKTV